MVTANPRAAAGERSGIIAAVRSPLGFFVLVVMVVETVLGTIALQSEAASRREAVLAMLGVIGLLVAVVSLFAWRKPEALLGVTAAAVDPEARAWQRQREFCAAVAGAWWQRITPVTLNALSFVEIEPAAGAAGLRLKGSTYDAQGRLSALWESSAACVTPDERRVFYAWRGWHPAEPGRPYGGYGEFAFGPGDGPAEATRAVGQLLRVNLADLGQTQHESVALQRADAADAALMFGGDTQATQQRVLRQLASGGDAHKKV